MCIFECFSLLIFWACLISLFTCCVTCCHCALNFFLLYVHTYACPLELQRISSLSVVCIFECFSLLMFWACLVSRFTCCVTCRHCGLKQLFFFSCMYIPMPVHWNIRMYVCFPLYVFSNVLVSMFWACLISLFTCCITCRHCAFIQLFFLLHVHTYGCPLEHQSVSLFSVVCILNVLVS